MGTKANECCDTEANTRSYAATNCLATTKDTETNAICHAKTNEANQNSKANTIRNSASNQGDHTKANNGQNTKANDIYFTKTYEANQDSASNYVATTKDTKTNEVDYSATNQYTKTNKDPATNCYLFATNASTNCWRWMGSTNAYCTRMYSGRSYLFWQSCSMCELRIRVLIRISAMA